MLIIDN